MCQRPILTIGVILVLFGLTMSTLLGQGPNVPATQSIGQEPYGAYASSATESVNLYNGNNNVGLGLFSLKGRNGQDISLTLSYNTKQIIKKQTGPGSFQYAFNYTGPTQGRWVLNNWPQKTTMLPMICNPIDNSYSIKPAYIITTPDGAKHEMHPTAAPYDDWIYMGPQSGCPSNPTWSGDARSITGTIMEFRGGTNNSKVTG